MDSQEYYAVLGVKPDASEEQIKQAYRAAALAHHPDRNANKPAAEQMFKRVAEAYSVLRDPKQRLAYHQSAVYSQQEWTQQRAEQFFEQFFQQQKPEPSPPARPSGGLQARNIV